MRIGSIHFYNMYLGMLTSGFGDGKADVVGDKTLAHFLSQFVADRSIRPISPIVPVCFTLGLV